jgi:Fur family transcriptional regulator, iron response regulator
MQSSHKEHGSIVTMLAKAGLRPTRQRLLLGHLLFSKGHRHLTAEVLHREARVANIGVSLATVYNTLHQFTKAGLLNEVTVEGSRSYFDTNVTQHHHFLCEESGELIDIPASDVDLTRLPPPPQGTRINRVDVVIRLGKAA